MGPLPKKNYCPVLSVERPAEALRADSEGNSLMDTLKNIEMVLPSSVHKKSLETRTDPVEMSIPSG